MKKCIVISLYVALAVIYSCTSTQPMSESTKLFMEEANLSMVVPLRFYSWIKVENSNRVQNDIFSRKIDFEYNNSEGYLLKTVSENEKTMSTWGNQLLIQEGVCRQIVFTAFIASIYALEDNKDPLDVAFNVLNQIFSDGTYTSYEKELIDLYSNGLQQYRIGGSAWNSYKKEYFIVANKTIGIK